MFESRSSLHTRAYVYVHACVMAATSDTCPPTQTLRTDASSSPCYDADIGGSHTVARPLCRLDHSTPPLWGCTQCYLVDVSA